MNKKNNLPDIKKQLMSKEALAQFRFALPTHITPERFQRVAWTAIQNAYGIEECDVKSVMNALIICAQEGLLPNGREAAIVKKGKVAAYMPMKQGILKMMYNSGKVNDVNVHVRYAYDEFDAKIINGVWQIVHVPKLIGDRGEILCVYATAHLSSGVVHAQVMTKKDIDERRAASPNGGVKDKWGNPTIWQKWYAEMAEKTVLHRLGKMLPLSSEQIDILNEEDGYVDMTGIEDNHHAKKEKSLIDNINQAVDAEFTESFDNGKNGLDNNSQEDQGEFVDVPI